MQNHLDQQLTHNLKKFNDRVKALNQTNAREMLLTAAEARQLQAEIFDLLVQIQRLADANYAQQNANITVELKSPGF